MLPSCVQVVVAYNATPLWVCTSVLFINFVQDPWPVFPGFGAKTLYQLQHSQEASPPIVCTPVKKLPPVVHKVLSPPKSYASAVSHPHRTGVQSPPAHSSAQVLSPLSSAPLSPPSAPMESGAPKSFSRSEAMKPKHARKSSSVMQQPLTMSNYKSKFSQLLASEESAHDETLKKKLVLTFKRQLHVLSIFF